MGFRCTFVTGWPGPRKLPTWFVEKWRDRVNFGSDVGFPISSKERTKGNAGSIVEDIQKALQECDYKMPVELVFVYECSGVTRVEISHDKIIYSEPSSWKRVIDADGHFIGDTCYDKTYQSDA
jgi:hypothetical protein